MNTIKNMDEATLHAYVDGQLTPYEAAEVAQWLQNHPDDAQRVLSWRSQRAALQGLHAEMLDEPLPPALLRRLQAAPATAANAAQFWRQGLAAACLLAVGLAGGWYGHASWPGGASPPQASGASTPAFVRDAAIAHVLYQPEQRHPVEVSAAEQAHLVQWLSKRLGQPLRVPDLRADGFALMGGRLLPAGEAQGGGGDHNAARAQFMYESAQGQRLTLYVSVSPASPAGQAAAPTAFRFAEQGQGAGLTRSFYWVDGALAYALSGPFGQEQLARLGSQVYAQLGGA